MVRAPVTGPETPAEFTEWSEDGEEITDRSNPVASSGRVPDHTATAEGESVASPSAPETPSRRPRPWDSITPRGGAGRKTGPRMAPTGAPKSKANATTSSSGETVAALPRGFEKQLTDMYVTVGTMIVPFDQVCGRAVVDAAPKCASTLVEYARTNADVRRVLLRLVGTTAFGAIIAAHTPIIMAIAAHHVAPLFNRAPNTDPFPVPEPPADPYIRSVPDDESANSGTGWAGTPRPRSRGGFGPRPDFGAI